MRDVRSSTLIRRCQACLGLLLGTALAVCVAATPASAYPIYKGTFTVTAELHWGKAVLPPGEYTLVLDDSTRTPTIVISDARTNKHIAIQFATFETNARNSDSQLRVASAPGQRVICSVRLAGFGEVFHSEAAYEMTRKGARIEEAVVITGSQTAGK